MSKNVIISIVVILVLLVGGAGAYYYFGMEDTEEKEEVGDTVPKTTKKEDIEKPEEGSYIDLDPIRARELLDDDNVVILDVSSAYENGHLPGAINHYVGDGSLDKAIPTFDKTKTYLVYCHVDSASISGAEKLVKAGFTVVYRLKGNYSAWIEKGYEVEVLLGAVGGYKGEGSAERSFVDGKFEHMVSAEIKDPASDKFYEGWLVNKNDEFFSTGKLEKKNGKYVLVYDSNEDQRNFSKVVVTEETLADGLDGKPEAHVLEGSF